MKRLLLIAAFAVVRILRAEEHATPKVPVPQAGENQPAVGDEPPQDVVRQILIEVQVIALPIEDALPLIEPLRDEAQIEKAVAKLHGMIAGKKARLIGWPSVITRSNQRAVVECIDEVRYAADFVFTPNPEAMKMKEFEVRMKRLMNSGFSFNPSTPTDFERRDTGITLEVEPTIDPQGTHVEMQLVPQHVSLAGFDKIPTKLGGRSITITQPVFHVNKVTTNITLRDGQSVLFGIFHTPKPEGWMELFILKSSILKW